MIKYVTTEKEYANNENQIKALNELLSTYGLYVCKYTNGPRVTQYYVELGIRTNVAAVKRLNFNIALDSNEVTVETKGKYLVITCQCNNNIVDLAELFRVDYYNLPGLQMALGKDVQGERVYADLQKLKHILIGGVTGSGKSVFLHQLILSMMCHTPRSWYVLIDPKGNEFTPYTKIPTVKTVTNMSEAKLYLKALCDKMDARYKELAQKSCRDIIEYNKKGGDMIPIVCVIDEYADLKMTAGDEAESYIIRLAQKSRACGIHLIIATQYPVRTVINNVVKANMPTRICLKVSQSIHSKVILDRVGGEKLLGNGDMLYLPDGATEPIRIQAAMVHQSEIDSIIENFMQATEFKK